MISKKILFKDLQLPESYIELKDQNFSAADVGKIESFAASLQSQKYNTSWSDLKKMRNRMERKIIYSIAT